MAGTGVAGALKLIDVFAVTECLGYGLIAIEEMREEVRAHGVACSSAYVGIFASLHYLTYQRIKYVSP